MVNKKKNSLFDPERFKWMEKDRDDFLKNLTVEKSANILERITTGESWIEFKKFFIFHICCPKKLLIFNRGF